MPRHLFVAGCLLVIGCASAPKPVPTPAGSEPKAAEGQKEEGGDGPADASLERLMSVIEDDMVTELVLFELAARVHPQYTLTLDDEARRRLRAYVIRHVLLPVGGLSATAPGAGAAPHSPAPQRRYGASR